MAGAGTGSAGRPLTSCSTCATCGPTSTRWTASSGPSTGCRTRSGEERPSASSGESGCGKSVTALSIMRLLDIPPAEIASGQIMFEGRDLLTLSGEEMRQVRGNDIAMIFQEPMTSLNPVFTVGDQIAEAVIQHKKLSRKAAWDKAVESHPPRRDQQPGTAGQAVPPRDVGRHAPAGDDRDGALVRPEAAHRRRADDRPRRDDPGPDPRADPAGPGRHRGRAAC